MFALMMIFAVGQRGEPMSDLISRQTAIDAVLSIGHIAKLTDGDAVIRMSAVNYVLRNLPSAEPVRKGKWQWLPDRDNENIRYLCCSVCHGDGYYESNYCPNCGADMRYSDD